MQHNEERNQPKKAKRLTAMSRLKLTHAAEMINMGAPAICVALVWRVSLPQVLLWMEREGLVENIQDNEYTQLVARLAARAWLRGR